MLPNDGMVYRAIQVDRRFTSVEMLPKQSCCIRSGRGSAADLGEGSVRLARAGFDLSPIHEEGDAVAADMAPRCPQFLVDPRRTRRTHGAPEHRLD